MPLAHPPEFRARAIEFETRDSGLTRIGVPERLGHDDLCMALALAVAGEGNVESRRRTTRAYGDMIVKARLPTMDWALREGSRRIR